VSASKKGSRFFILYHDQSQFTRRRQRAALP
jgi:hypothetical protein